MRFRPSFGAQRRRGGASAPSSHALAASVTGVATVTADLVVPSGGATYPNEPAGLTLNTTYTTDWEAASLGAWTSGQRSNWNIKFLDGTRSVSIATEDASVLAQARMLRFTYPSNHSGGGGVEVHFDNVSSGAVRRAYVGAYVRLSANWHGHPSGIMKLWYFDVHDASVRPLWCELNGSGTETLFATWISQLPGTTGTDRVDGPQNVPRGQWLRVETYVDFTHPSGARAYYWINGVLVLDQVFNVNSSLSLRGITLSGIMGGVGATGNPATQYYDIADVRLAFGS